MNRSGIHARGGVPRRGNALVLVAGALVLLVIIASAYLSSAQGIRKTTMAQRRAVNVDAAAGVIAEDIAREISEALFVREIDPSVVTSQFGDTSVINRQLDIVTSPLGPSYSERFLEDRRLPLTSTNYFQEMGRSQRRYEVDRNFSWNYAPFEVVPSTNWPDYAASWHGYDELTGLWASAFTNGIGLTNAPGQPGTSDTRWLRDLEPLRASTEAYLGAEMGLDPTSNVDSFSHYGHLSNLARPGNDWRICRDIADVTGVLSPTHDAMEIGEIMTPVPLPFDPAEAAPDGFHYFGGLLRDHHVPVEQWLSLAPTVDAANGQLHRSIYSGTTYFTTPVDFWRRWERWFDYAGYAYAQAQAANGIADLVPPNFYDLSNLDADTVLDGGGGGEVLGSLTDDALQGDAIGERPEDEFIRGSARWHVSRVLSDTDGDGFTDSFWFHVPGRGSEGTMQIVGVSVTDNAGRLNANTATRFVRADENEGWRTRTRGWTPSDLALVGQNAQWSPTGSNSGWDEQEPWRWGPKSHETWNVGLLDRPTTSTGLFDIERPTGNPQTSSELVGFYRQGLDAIDKTPAQQNTSDDRAKSEVFPIWRASYYRGQVLGDFLSETSVQYNRWFPEQANNIGGSPLENAQDVHRQVNRLFYFRNAGSDPQNPRMSFTPFTMSDEIELRSNEGNNQPWLMTRFERSLGPSAHSTWSGDAAFLHPLRSFSHRQEHAELVDQLSNRQLFFDNRRKITLFNASRNEQLPPWLWWEYRGSRQTVIDPNTGFVVPGTSVHGVPLSPPIDLGGVVGPPEDKDDPDSSGNVAANQDWIDEDWWNVVPRRPERPVSFGAVRNAPNTRLEKFYDQMRQKLDLREHERWIQYQPILAGLVDYRPRTFSERLPYALFMALHSGDLSPVSTYTNGISMNPFDDPTDAGDGVDSKNRTRELAASYAANILAWRDPDSDAPLYTQNVANTGSRFDGTREYGAVRAPIFLDDLDVPNWSSNEPENEYTVDGSAEPAFLGMEMQPFILEAFVAHVVEPWNPNVEKTIEGTRYQWGTNSSGGSTKRLLIEYQPGDESTVPFTVNEQQSREIIADASDGIPSSKTVAVVQIANPYDRPLPLFDRNPLSGLLDRELPLYSVSLFGQKVVIDDTLIQLSEEGYDPPLGSYDYAAGGEPRVLPPNPVAQLPLYLPPATPERPYTLVLFVTGFNPGGTSTNAEDLRWIDFLDITPEDHFYGAWNFNGTFTPDVFPLQRDADGNGVVERLDVEELGLPSDGYLEINPGDLICRVPSGVWATNRTHYDDENNDPDGVAIELIRTHRRDYDANKLYTDVHVVAPGQQCYDYEVDVVVDRTGTPASGASSAEDEFFETVTEVLEYERLPNLSELGTNATKLNGAQEVGGGGGGGGGFGGGQSADFDTKPVIQALVSRFGSNSDYSRIVNKLNTTGNTTERSFQFDVTMPTGVNVAGVTGSSADSVRWCQWARYTRAWGVDPGYPGIETAGATPPRNTYFLPSPINHMSRRAARYVAGVAQVTRSKGRPLIDTESIEPLDSESKADGFFAGMEQVEGVVFDRSGVSLGTIAVLNGDSRTVLGGNNKQRYMYEDLDGTLSNTQDVKPSWGYLYDSATDPDGEFDAQIAADPDRHWGQSPWMTRHYRLPYSRGAVNQEQEWYFASRKPTFFDMNRDQFQGYLPFTAVSSAGTDPTYEFNFPDKGFYGYDGIRGYSEFMPFGFQMLQKDANFEQVGEVLNVFLYGHELLMPAGPPIPGVQVQTTRTFSEAMAGIAYEGDPDGEQPSGGGGPILGQAGSGALAARGSSHPELVDLYDGLGRSFGRLVMDPQEADDANGGAMGNAVGKAASGNTWPYTNRWLSDLGHAEPDLTAAQRVTELFVCDGPGVWDIYHAQQNQFGFGDGVIDTPQQAAFHLGYDPAFGNAMDFDGSATSGLVNINTATIEVMQSLPHMYKLVPGTPDWQDGSILESVGTSENTLFDPNPRVAIPEAISRYRNLQGFPGLGGSGTWRLQTGHAFGPDYFERGIAESGATEDIEVRGGRGFAALGELFNVNQEALEDFNAYRFNDRYPSSYVANKQDPGGNDIYLDAWSMTFAANSPFTRELRQRLRSRQGNQQAWYNQSLEYDMRVPNPTWVGFGQDWSKQVPAPSMLSTGAPLSTDVNGEPFLWASGGNGWFESAATGKIFDTAESYRGGDKVAEDAEEANLLFAGISNMITTRSDVFTVHFRVRTFVQNPETGVWDATDPDSILDDSRYVMLVDRSEVDTPEDSPRILYLQKVSN